MKFTEATNYRVIHIIFSSSLYRKNNFSSELTLGCFNKCACVSRRIVIIQRKSLSDYDIFAVYCNISIKFLSFTLLCSPPNHIFAKTLFSFRVLLLSSDHVHVIIFFLKWLFWALAMK